MNFNINYLVIRNMHMKELGKQEDVIKNRMEYVDMKDTKSLIIVQELNR